MAFVAVPSLASHSLALLTDFAQSESDGSINDLGKLATCCCCQQVWLDGRGSLSARPWKAPLRAVPMPISLGHRRVAGGAADADAGAAGRCWRRWSC